MFTRKSSIILIVLAVLCVAVPALSAEQNEQVLKTIPADVLFCAKIKNIEYTANMVDQFLVGVSPIPFATSMFVRVQLTQLLGNPELKGVNMAGSFAVFATVEPNQTIPDVYALIPITDYGRVTDVNTNVPKPDANGISTITFNGKPLGCITNLGAYALLAGDYAKTLNMGKSLSAAKTPSLFAALGPDEIKQADSELIWAYGNIQKASKNYGPMLLDKIEQLKKTMNKSADPNVPAPPMDPAFIMDAYSCLFRTLLDEGQSLTIAATPKPDLLLVKTTFKARSGTETANILTADSAPPQKNNLTGYLKDGAVMNFVARANCSSMKKLSPKIIDMTSRAVGRDTNAPDIVKLKTISAELVDSLGEFYACSFSVDPNSKSPFVAEYFLQVKDADKLNKTIDEFAKTWSSGVFDDFYKKMGMKTTFTIKRGVDNYKGITIDSARFDMGMVDGNSPESQMINKMYGSGMNYRWAIVNGLWVCKISGDPNAVYKLIDQAKAGPPAAMCSEMQKAMPLIPDANNMDFVATYNYLRLFKVIGTMMPVPMPSVDVATKSNLVFAAKLQNGSVTVDIAVPKEHLTEMMTMFQMMMMQQQMPRQQQQPMTMPPPTAP